MGLEGRSRDHLEAYWLSHMRVGFGVFVGESLAVLAYLLASPKGANSGVLIGIALSGACVGSLSFLVLDPIARRPWRAGFSLAWSLGAGWLLALCVHLDGGLDSPLLFLVLIPVIYAALGYRPAGVVACAVSSFAELIAISATDTQVKVPREDLLMIGAVIGGISVLAVAAAVYRAKLQQSEALLTRKLAALATIDNLTGCLNHRTFYERLAAEVDRVVRYDRPLSLIIVDIDDFKAVNDTYGHPVGDKTLATVGKALRGEMRSADVVGRIGGDEFGVILADTRIDGAEIHARRISRSVEQHSAPTVTLSIGMASLEHTNPSSIQLFKDADQALYHVKRTGRHGVATTASNGTPTRLAS